MCVLSSFWTQPPCLAPTSFFLLPLALPVCASVLYLEFQHGGWIGHYGRNIVQCELVMKFPRPRMTLVLALHDDGQDVLLPRKSKRGRPTTGWSQVRPPCPAWPSLARFLYYLSNLSWGFVMAFLFAAVLLIFWTYCFRLVF